VCNSSSKLRAYGYKSFWMVTAGPFLQFISLPIYLYSYGTSLRKYAIAISEIGSKITNGEMIILNWTWLGFDIVFFLLQKILI